MNAKKRLDLNTPYRRSITLGSASWFLQTVRLSKISSTSASHTSTGKSRTSCSREVLSAYRSSVGISTRPTLSQTSSGKTSPVTLWLALPRLLSCGSCCFSFRSCSSPQFFWLSTGTRLKKNWISTTDSSPKRLPTSILLPSQLWLFLSF